MSNLFGNKGPTGAGQIPPGFGQKANPGSQGAATTPPQAATPRPAAGGGVSRDDYWANKEARDLEKEKIYREQDIPAIRRSTAYSVASTVLAAAITADAVGFGTAAKSKRLDMLLGMMDLVAEHVYARLNGEPSPTADAGDEDEPQQYEMNE